MNIRTCAETDSARETAPLGGIAEYGMSDYYKKLDSIAKTRYLEKLKLLGLDEKDDPYDPINSHNFVDDMTRWPAVEYGHIFCYYIIGVRVGGARGAMAPPKILVKSMY